MDDNEVSGVDGPSCGRSLAIGFLTVDCPRVQYYNDYEGTLPTLRTACSPFVTP